MMLQSPLTWLLYAACGNVRMQEKIVACTAHHLPVAGRPKLQSYKGKAEAKKQLKMRKSIETGG